MSIIVNEEFSFARDGSGWTLTRTKPLLPGEINPSTKKPKLRGSTRQYFYPTLVMMLKDMLDIGCADQSGDIKSLMALQTKLAREIVSAIQGVDSTQIGKKPFVPEVDTSLVAPAVTKAVVKVIRRKAKPMPTFRRKD